MNTLKPKDYYDISPCTPRRGRSRVVHGVKIDECLLWGYSKENKYVEIMGVRHKSKKEFSGVTLFATGRIHDGRGSAVFTAINDNIYMQRKIAEELYYRHPNIVWWVFDALRTGSVLPLGKFLGD